MICIILVAGHSISLEAEIKESTEFQYLRGVPKALLPGVKGKRILDYWWEAIKTRQLFNQVYLVTNADKYKHYERWATASEFPAENIINDGTTTPENSIGAVADVELVLRTRNIQEDIMIVAGDMLFQDAKFDIAQVLKYFQLKNEGDLAIYYEMEDEEIQSTRGIVEVSPDDNKVTCFYEKPQEGETSSRLASVVFYCLRRQTLNLLHSYMEENADVVQRNFGKFMSWLINEKQQTVYGMKLPTGFQLIGKVGLADYQRWLKYFSEKQQKTQKKCPITKRAYARVGMMGNPSDGFHGKTIAMTIANFWAEVTIYESDKLVLTPHPLNDPTEFGSLGDLYGISRKEGYLGGLRLLQATCKKFYQYCSEKGLALARRNFTLKYDTNIPRQVGLAGSSAIVVATLKCLMTFFNLTDHDMPLEFQPQFVLDVEKDDLFIQAGLQDRVVQVYEGLVYMDFSEELFNKQGHGSYISLDMTHLPQFWLAYLSDPSDSGKIHSDIGARWRNGDPVVRAGMKTFAQITDKAKAAFENQDWETFANLMNENFNLRQELYGDKALGSSNLRMIELARSHGAAAKFSGSGGAIVGMSRPSTNVDEMRKAFQAEGFVFCDIIPYCQKDC